MKPTLTCLRAVLPGDTFVLGFHLQLYVPAYAKLPVQYGPTCYTIRAAKM